MTHSQWNSTLETGNELVDSEHRQLFDMINELHDAIVEQRGREAQDEVLVRLGAYGKVHFAHEEALMRSIRYPGLVDQKRMHKEFLAEAGRLADEYSSGELLLPITLAIYLRGWLLDHIRTEDRKIVEFIRASEAGTY